MTLNLKNKSIFRQVLLGLFLVFLSTLSAGLIVFSPSSIVARFAMIIALCFAIVLAWGLRAEANKVPDKFVFGLMMSVVVLSVAWPRYIFFSAGSLPKVNPYTLSLIVGLSLILLLSINMPDFSRRLAQSIKNGGVIFSLALIWLLWRLFANFFGEYPIFSSLDYLRESIYLSSFLLFGVAIASYDDGPKVVLRLIMLVAFFVGSAGLIEAFQQHNIFVGFAAQDADGGLAKVIESITKEKIRSGAYRAQSTFDHPIVFAQFFSALVPLAFYSIVYEKKLFWRFLSITLTPIAFLAILESGSRAGIASLVVAASFWGMFFWFRTIVQGGVSKFLAILSLPLFGLGVAFAVNVIQNLALGGSEIESGSSAWRMVMINSGINTLSSSPFWGFGQGMAISKAGIVNPSGIPTIDSYLLTLAIDSGYVGLLLFLMLIFTFVYKGFKSVTANNADDAMFVGACVAGVMAIITTFTVLSITSNMTFLWILITATFPYINKNRHSKFPEEFA